MYSLKHDLLEFLGCYARDEPLIALRLPPNLRGLAIEHIQKLRWSPTEGHFIVTLDQLLSWAYPLYPSILDHLHGEREEEPPAPKESRPAA